MEIVNLLPHVVRIFSPSDKGTLTLFDRVGDPVQGEILLEIPPSGEVAKARPLDTPAGVVEGGGVKIPTVRRGFSDPSGLPAPQEGVLFLVNFIVASAAREAGRNVDDLLIPGTLLKNEEGVPWAVTELVRP